MTYLAACTVATLLLAVFVMVSIWMHLARKVQHEKFMRQQKAVRDNIRTEVDTLCALRDQLYDKGGKLETMRSLILEAEQRASELQAANLAGQRLDETMRRTIAEGIDLARVLDAGNTRFCELVAARQEQREHEDTTMATWAKIRDDLETFAASYPSYVFQSDGETRGQG